MALNNDDTLWKPMRMASAGKSKLLPGKRGRYLLWLEPPFITGRPRWFHFSWVGEAFCLRDYTTGMKRNQDRTTKAADVWQLAAKGRIPCHGNLYRPLSDYN